MKTKRILLILSILFYLFSIIIIGAYLLFDLTKTISMTAILRLLLLIISCIFLYFGGFYLSKYRNDNKPMKVNLWIFFILYLLLFFTLTLFDEYFGRTGFFNISWSSETLNSYLKDRFNIIPFATITSYINAFDSLYDTSTIMYNLLGNIVACIPMAFFLPLLFKKQNNFKVFLITIILFVLGIELLQFITLSGSCDIDDLILNVSFALIIYKILKIPSLNKLLRNIFLLENNKIKRSSIVKIVIVFFIVVSLGVGLVFYRRTLYDKNLEEYDNYYNYRLEIVDDSLDCDGEKELFFEDKYYEYYFNCKKSDNVYAVINDNEKYLVKDLLNSNNIAYYITIDKMKDAGLEYTRVNKYEEINISGTGEIYADIKIDDEKLVNIEEVEAYSDYDINNPTSSKYRLKFFVIPKEVGETNASIRILNAKDDTLNLEKKYKINVDKDLNVMIEELS